MAFAGLGLVTTGLGQHNRGLVILITDLKTHSFRPECARELSSDLYYFITKYLICP